MAEFQIPGLKEAIDKVAELHTKVDAAAQAFADAAKNAEKMTGAFKDAGGLKDLNDLLKTNKGEVDKVAAAKAKLNSLQKDEAVEIAKVNIQIQQQIEKNKFAAASQSDQATALQKFNAQAREATNTAKNLGAQMAFMANEGKKNTVEYKILEEEFKKASTTSKQLNDQYRDFSKTAGDNRALVGSYSAELKDHFEGISTGLEKIKSSLASGNISGAFSGARDVIKGFASSVNTATKGAHEANEEMKKSGEVTSQFSQGLERIKIGFTSSSEKLQEFKTTQNLSNESTQAGTAATGLQSRAQLILAGTTDVASGAFKLLRIAIAGTGIGLLVIALGSLIGYFTQTQSGIDKLNSVLQPLKAIFFALEGVVLSLGSKLVDTFSHPKKAMEDLYEFVKQNLINRFTAFKEILEGILNLDFKRVVNGAIQATTGVENMTDKIASAAKATGKFLDENARKGSEMAEITKQMNAEQLKYNANQAEVTAEIEKQRLISKDTSKSFAERGAAAREIIRITKENGDAEAHILQLKQKNLEIEQGLKGAANLTNADKQEGIEIEESIAAAKRKGTESEIEQSRILGGMRKEEQKQYFDGQKAKLESTISTQKLTLDHIIATYKQEENSLDKNVAFFRTISAQKQQIAELELQKNLTGVAKNSAEYNKILSDSAKAVADIKLEESNAIAKIQKDGLAAELSFYENNNKSILENAGSLTDALVAEENKRLADLLEVEKKKKRELLKIEESLTDEKLKQIASTAEGYASLTDVQRQYYDYIAKKAADTDKQIKKNDSDLLTAKLKNIDTEEKDSIRKFTLLKKGIYDNQVFEFKTINDSLKKKKAELAEELKDDKKTANEKAAISKQMDDIDTQSSENQVKLAKFVSQNKVDALNEGLSTLIEIAGKETAVGKAAAIAQATINTYEGVTKALAAYAPPYNFIVAALVGAAGFVNIAKIAGMQTSFETGTAFAPYTGIATVDEKGAEIHTDKFGNIKSFGSDKGAHLTNITQGDKIIPADISAIIKSSLFASYGMTKADNFSMSIDYDKIGEQFAKHNQTSTNKIVSAIRNNRSSTNIEIKRDNYNRVRSIGQKV